MKRFFASVTLVAGLLLVVGQGGAAVSTDPGPHGSQDGTGPIHEFLPFDCTGIVLGYLPSDGMLLEPDLSLGSNSATCDETTETVAGVGSMSYWEDELGYVRPAKGEVVQVQGYTFIDNLLLQESNVACAVLFADGTVVTLRTACP